MIKTHPLRAVTLLTLVGLTACGGNYSNDDIEYQTSVPQAEDLTPNIAAQLVANSAETYRFTYGMVGSYRAILGFVASLLDHVRQNPATQRLANGRVWGPFPDREHPGFEVKVMITRGGDAAAPQFTYSVDFASARTRMFVPVIFGTFDPRGAIGDGSGQVTLDFAGLRSTGFPGDRDTTNIMKIEMVHGRKDGSRTLEVHQTNTEAADNRRTDLTYAEAPDGAARTHFVMAVTNNLWAQELDVVSAWRSDGAGRGELKVTQGLATGLLGIDCWGPSTVATYVRRDWNEAVNAGDVNTCVLPALR
ncbi:MAG: hypothetical protein SF187_19755 [Deltaproteobacteria bacterium]|nr:hypothetical protein [Deltaproteobacteria bacterium]